MDVTVLKLILLLVMIAGVLVAGLLPLRLLKRLRQTAARASTSRQHKHVSLVLCLLTCFSGGVFLATCFLHLFPELLEAVELIKENYDLHISYPVAELLSCLGFFLLFFLEEVVIMAIPSMAHGHSHHTTHNNPDESLMLAGQDGCCMATGVPLVKEKEKGETIEEVKEMLESREEAEGHCQRHCPLTVHRRHSAGVSTMECTSSSPEYSPAKVRKYYGSLDTAAIKLREEDRVYTAVILAEPERCETNCEKVDEDPPILMKSSPHAHSHGVRSITFVLAISFHAVIEGMAFGVQTNVAEVSALFVSLLVHKLIVAFSVGLQLARTHAHQLHLVVVSVVILSLTSPLGAVIGMGVESSNMDSFSKDVLIAVFQGLAVGTFLYVTFFEVLLHERDNEHPNLLKLLLILLGFSLIGLVRLADSHEHSHSHSHTNGTLEH